jgi:hypothetical protein
MDLNKIVNDSLAKLEANGDVENIVTARLKKTIDSIVDDLFSSYSDFGKSLKTEVQSALNVNLKELNLTGYNVMVLNAVKDTLDETLHIQGVEKIKESLGQMLSNVKTEYRLSELIEEMKKEANEDGNYDEEEISFHIDSDRSILTFIYFDEESDKEKYQCKYRLWIDKQGVVCGVEISDRKFDNRVIMGGLHGFEQTLFKIYSMNPKIIIDEGRVETGYGYSGEDD